MEFMTTREVSNLLRVPETTLYVWTHRGYGPRSVRVGKHRRYRRAEVSRWLTGLETVA